MAGKLGCYAPGEVCVLIGAGTEADGVELSGLPLPYEVADRLCMWNEMVSWGFARSSQSTSGSQVQVMGAAPMTTGGFLVTRDVNLS